MAARATGGPVVIHGGHAVVVYAGLPGPGSANFLIPIPTTFYDNTVMTATTIYLRITGTSQAAIIAITIYDGDRIMLIQSNINNSPTNVEIYTYDILSSGTINYEAGISVQLNFATGTADSWVSFVGAGVDIEPPSPSPVVCVVV
jgi:hypothetical protein